MSTGYYYNLWNGKEIIGTCYVELFPLNVKEFHLPTMSILKEKYRNSQKITTIKIPLVDVVVEEKYNSYKVERMLDIRRKSKRQIEIIKNN